MKGMAEITSIRDTRSLHSVGGGCIPKHQRSANLELYVLGSEKSRLEKEVFALDKRRNTASKQLECVSRRIEKLQEETHIQRKAKAAGGTPAKPLRRMAISY
jgi:hypothetical protein